MINTPFPPPYVPQEYMHCKLSEIPEPYRQQIKDWIANTESHYQAVLSMHRANVIGFLITLVCAFAAVITVFLFQ